MSKRLSTRIVSGDVAVTFPKRKAAGTFAFCDCSATFFIVSRSAMSHHLQFQSHLFLQKIGAGFLHNEEGTYADVLDPDIQGAPALTDRSRRAFTSKDFFGRL